MKKIFSILLLCTMSFTAGSSVQKNKRTKKGMTRVVLEVRGIDLKKKGDILFQVFTKKNWASKATSKMAGASGKKPVGTKRTVFFTARLVPGRYGIRVLHDEDSNQKIKMGLFGPKEGNGFSKNFKPKFSFPDFKDVSFDVKGQKLHMVINMNY